LARDFLSKQLRNTCLFACFALWSISALQAQSQQKPSPSTYSFSGHGVKNYTEQPRSTARSGKALQTFSCLPRVLPLLIFNKEFFFFRNCCKLQGISGILFQYFVTFLNISFEIIVILKKIVTFAQI